MSPNKNQYKFVTSIICKNIVKQLLTVALFVKFRELGMQENKNSISGIYDGYGFIAYIAKETFVESFKKKKHFAGLIR